MNKWEYSIGENRITQSSTCPSDTLSTQIDLGYNPGLRSERPVTNRQMVRPWWKEFGRVLIEVLSGEKINIRPNTTKFYLLYRTTCFDLSQVIHRIKICF